MRELSLNILDITQNSISAGAKNITIKIVTDTNQNDMIIEIVDNGKGMSEEFLKRVTDPFVTTRTTRKVGLGIPLFKQAAEDAGGELKITSTLGKGTCVKASFMLNHIDRQPVGDLGGTVSALIGCNPDVDFTLNLEHDGQAVELQTRKLREILGEVPLDAPEIAVWLRGYIQEQMNEIYGGVDI